MRANWAQTLPAHPARRDAVIAAAWLVAGCVAWTVGLTGIWRQLAVIDPPRWAFLVTLAGATATLLLRSRRPMLALGLGAAVALADTLMGASLAVVFVLTDLIYAAVKYGSAKAVRGLLRVATAAAVALAAALLLLAPEHPDVAVALVQWGLIVTVSGLWGWNVRAERKQTAAELAARHTSETRELRTRIAHDLHDLVANQIAVAGLHVEAAKLQAAKLQVQSEALAQGLDRAKKGTDRAHHELRGLISVLTLVDEAGNGAPVDVAGELAALGDLLPAGRAVRWGDGAVDALRAALPAGQGPRARILLRALQELTANAAKHGAGDAHVWVEETSSGAALTIAIENAVGSRAPGATPATGLGIEGTRALLRGIGGELQSGPTAGGWVAVVTLPNGTPGGAEEPRMTVRGH